MSLGAEVGGDAVTEEASEGLRRGWALVVVALRDRSLGGGGACSVTVLSLEGVKGAMCVVDILDVDLDPE